ncbi:MAG: hypothetical protein ABL907_20700 [Hyphomicrobium sp.]
MKHQADCDFWAAYDALPGDVRKQADRAFALIKQDPKHPSLHFKKIGRRWSARVGIKYRALALETEDGFLWYWIGTHAGYDRLIGH